MNLFRKFQQWRDRREAKRQAERVENYFYALRVIKAAIVIVAAVKPALETAQAIMEEPKP